MVHAKFLEMEFVFVPMILLLVFFMVVFCLWILCWICDDWAVEESQARPQTEPHKRVAAPPLVVHNVNDQHMICIQNVSSNESSEQNIKEGQKEKQLKSWSRLLTRKRAEEIHEKPSIQENHSKKASNEAKIESHLETSDNQPKPSSPKLPPV